MYSYANTKRRVIFLGIMIVFSGFIFLQTSSVDERGVKSIFYSSINLVEELYSYHNEQDGLFYNEKFSEEADVQEYLAEYLTEGAVDKVIGKIYQSSGDQLIYRDEFQQYLTNRRVE